MNRINPLYIIVLCMIIMIGSFLINSNEMNTSKKSNEKVIAFTNKAIEYSKIKKKKRNNDLNYLLTKNEFKEILTYKKTSKSLSITLKTKNKRVMENFLNKFIKLNIFIEKFYLTKEMLKIEAKL